MLGRAWLGVVLVSARGTGIMRLATFAGVQPGDALHLDLGTSDTATTATISLAVPTFSGAVTYLIDSSCGSVGLDSGAQGSVTLAGCGGVADMIVVPQD